MPLVAGVAEFAKGGPILGKASARDSRVSILGQGCRRSKTQGSEDLEDLGMRCNVRAGSSPWDSELGTRTRTEAVQDDAIQYLEQRMERRRERRARRARRAEEKGALLATVT